MAEKIFDAQSNYGWGLSLNMTGKAPAVAKRIFDKYSDALAYVNDFNDSAIEGLQLSVVADTDSKKNGVYFVEKIGTFVEADGVKTAKNDGVLVKVGGTETETATNYSAAVALSNNLAIGQIIKVSNEEIVGDQKYKAGFYIVNGAGSISALDTSTGSTDEIGALINRVTELESGRVKNTDFETYKAGIVTALEGKAAAADLSTHTLNANIHVTIEDKAKWNNAEENAKSYAAEEIAKLSTVYDVKGAAGTAESNAKTYTDEEIVKAKAYADQAEADANSYADGLNSAMDTRVKSLEDHKDDYKDYADQAELDAVATANAYTDGKDSAMNTRVAALETAKDDYKAYADQAELDAVATANAYTDGKDSAMNTRVAALEAIDHDKLATDAAASAVATVLDGAPAKFDTLKEIAEWIAESDTAEDAASLVTRVSALESIDHDAYVSADETNLAAAKAYTDEEIVKAKAYADQAETDAIAAAKSETESQVSALANGAVKSNTDALAVINGDDTVEGSIAKAKADAIAAALAKIAELDVANVYETKSDASAKLEAAKAYTDEREVEINKNIAAAESAAKAYTDEVAGVYSSEGVEASGLRKEIEDNEKVTSAALTELDGRVSDLEDHKEDYKAYADQAEADAIATANAYSTAYTDTLFESIKFAENSDIDGLFTTVEA